MIYLHFVSISLSIYRVCVCFLSSSIHLDWLIEKPLGSGSWMRCRYLFESVVHRFVVVVLNSKLIFAFHRIPQVLTLSGLFHLILRNHVNHLRPITTISKPMCEKRASRTQPPNASQ